MKEIECEYCKKYFFPDKKSRRFCSMACHRLQRSLDSLIETTCQYCGNTYITKKIAHDKFLNNKKKYECCSPLCSNRMISMNNKGSKNKKYDRLEKECLMCGKKYMTKRSTYKTSKYCDKYCLAKSKEVKARVELVCLFCKDTFYVKKGDLNALGEIKYCSKKCRRESSKKRIYFKCTICGKEYWQHLAYSKTSVTCSVDCQKKWQSAIYSKRPEVNKRLKNQGANSQRSAKKKRTSPEIIVERYLVDNNIDFISQYKVADSFSADFYLPDFNCVLEVYGDYWHSNPIKYGKNKKPLSNLQKKIKTNDKRRKNILTKEYHYYFYELWEKDINKDIDKSMKKFLKHINLKIRNESVI